MLATSPDPAPLGHRADVQGLRALAVLLVVADHAGLGSVAGGFVGVDVFFVLSGFLITSLLVREVATCGRVSITGFYARRARRILPAATVTLLVVLAWCARNLAPVQVAEAGQDARWSALFAANVHFGQAGRDYFDDDRAVSPFQHYWSLAVEEQFYLVWPLLLGIVVLAGGRLTRHVAPLLTVLCSPRRCGGCTSGQSTRSGPTSPPRPGAGSSAWGRCLPCSHRACCACRHGCVRRWARPGSPRSSSPRRLWVP